MEGGWRLTKPESATTKKVSYCKGGKETVLTAAFRSLTIFIHTPRCTVHVDSVIVCYDGEDDNDEDGDEGADFNLAISVQTRLTLEFYDAGFCCLALNEFLQTCKL